MAELIGPGEPGEAAGMRAKNLKNLPLILLPKSEGTGDGQEGPYTFISCDVWVLDRSGIVDHGSDVQVSWKRDLDNLRERMGKYIACRPIEDGNSVILVDLVGEALKVAEAALKDIEAEAPSGAAENGEPF